MTKKEVLKRYNNVERIEKGGQKLVYKGVDKEGRVLALKFIANPADRRVLQEITLVQSLELDNVPKIFESNVVFDEGVDENVLFIVEEFIDGCTLRKFLKDGNRFDLKQAYEATHSLLEIEMVLEEKRIIHRDIKPENIILDHNGKIYLIDFGIAKMLDGESLTATEALHGPHTPGYVPMEQYNNVKSAQDVRTDLFAIGVTIYEACSGYNPFRKNAINAEQVMANTVSVIPQELKLNGDTNGYFSRYIGMLMGKKQSQRPSSAKIAMEYLESIRPTLNFGG